MTRAGAKAEEFIRPGRSQPLKPHGQLGAVEVFADVAGRIRLRWQRGRNRSTCGIPSPSVVLSQPSSDQTIGCIAVSRPSVHRPRFRRGRPHR